MCIESETLDYHDQTCRSSWAGLVMLLLSGCASSQFTAHPQARIQAGNGLVSSSSNLRHARNSTHRVIGYALSLEGSAYRMGGASPKEGFDCSGFVQHVYARHGVFLPRTAAQLAASLPPVEWPGLRPGDLLFFNTRGSPYSHVGIYMDKEHFVHAPGGRNSRTVRVSRLRNSYWLKHFSGARRPL